MFPRSIDRRDFLHTALGIGALYLSGCSGREAEPARPVAHDGTGKLPGTDLPDPVTSGDFLESLDFLGEERAPLGQKRRNGHDCRRAIDLASLIEPDTRLTPTENFYIRTDYPDLLDPHLAWTLNVHGHVREPKKIPVEELLPFVEPRGIALLECAGNSSGLAFGLLSVARWSGIPFAKILELANPTDDAKRVLISGFDERTTTSTHSTPGCSWVFTFDDLAKSGAYLATEMNGGTLPRDHGAPIRLIAPNWYGCCNVKWVNEIQFVGDDEPATAQMIEFASRTHQEGVPRMAKEFAPATMDFAAIPVRIEKWRSGGKLVYRVLGIAWGGDQPSETLAVRFASDEDWQPVSAYAPRVGDLPFGIWCHRWEPQFKGGYTITLKATNSAIRTRRLDQDFYARRVRITEV